MQEIEPEVYAEMGAPQVIDPPPPTVSVTVEVHDWAVAVVVVVTVVMIAGFYTSASCFSIGQHNLQECPRLKSRLPLQ